MLHLKKTKNILMIICLLLLGAAASVCIYVSNYYTASPEAHTALQSDEVITVTVQENGNIIFAPETPHSALIFYPGGKVEHIAYAPLLHTLAEEGWLCVLVEMPFRLAVLDKDAAEGIPEQFPHIDNWYIGGHSLGGAMAASYAAEHAETFTGLVLLAAYSTADLSQSGLRTYTLYGSEDGVLDRTKYEEYRTNLPEDTIELVIDGGCHAYFGDYGSQAGDGEPAISAMEQVQITVEFFPTRP